MSDVIVGDPKFVTIDQETPDTPTSQQSTGKPSAESIDPAQFRKARREAEQYRKELESLRASAAEAERSKMSDVERLRHELDSIKRSAEELTVYRAYAEATRDQLLSQLPDDVRNELSDALTDLSPLAQIKQIQTLMKLSSATAAVAQRNTSAVAPDPRKLAVDRSRPVPTTDTAAPRTYSEWLSMPDGPTKNKYRALAMTLPD